MWGKMFSRPLWSNVSHVCENTSILEIVVTGDASVVQYIKAMVGSTSSYYISCMAWPWRPKVRTWVHPWGPSKVWNEPMSSSDSCLFCNSCSHLVFPLETDQIRVCDKTHDSALCMILVVFTCLLGWTLERVKESTWLLLFSKSIFISAVDSFC